MNRDIKFRVWDLGKKVFIPTDAWAITTSNFSHFAIMIKDWEDYKEGEYMYPNTQTLSEYTGLKDKNGKEIYEGDKTERGYVVMWSEQYASFCEHFYLSFTGIWSEASYPIDARRIKVVGHVFENSELISQ